MGCDSDFLLEETQYNQLLEMLGVSNLLSDVERAQKLAKIISLGKIPTDSCENSKVFMENTQILVNQNMNDSVQNNDISILAIRVSK